MTIQIRDQLHDPIWRLNNLYTIQDKTGNRVPFKPNVAQLAYLRDNSKSDIILKARQLGFTTLMCLVALDEVIFLNDWRAAIIAHTVNDANEIFESKVKFPYDNLPDAIRDARPAKNDRAGMLRFEHGSSIRVATSARSGTLQRLHVSEFGKICANYPKKAREIVTGAFPAVGQNAKTIESTAEGQEGYFFQFCQEAQRGAGQFKFHFFPWWKEPGYVWRPDLVVETAEDRAYFEALEIDHGIKLTPEQRAWWLQQEMTLGGDMKRENPSTADEAFEQAIEGAYFAPQLAHSDKHGLIGRFPYDPKYPVNTFWDLGRNDMTTIWFHQRIGTRDRFIGYYENSGEHISHYARYVSDWARQRNASYADHYWPHDGDREDLFLEDGRLAEAEKHGLSPRIVQRAQSKMHAIDAARARFSNCDFDAAECAVGIKHLRHYRKEWDEHREVWKDRPLHNTASHGADGFMTFACGYQPVSSDWDKPLRRGMKGIA
ncbi:hypothetical protein [Paracoccus sulfuroxidans]|uniref:Terminase n=1 Tax=Paracoccus sulfuroxidans TaxID=384678 RepID=A0A562NL80_9RHOB|nr:hypothetical protein [Paracoccus sulfuroxidans]TWI32751.1 hypothetical protein IQ24_02626 [Paracoccus sulfuroxidans]